MNITASRDEAFEAIAEMLRSNIKKTKIASKLAADYCVSDKTVYKWITRVEEMYDIEPIESILQQQKTELKSEIYQDLISTLSAEIPEEDPGGMMTKSMMFSSFVRLGKTQEVFDKSIEVIKLEKSNEVKKILLAQLQQQFPEKLKGKEPKDF